VIETRAFNFRGSEAKPNDSVLVYSVKIDQGMSSDAALKLYDDALQADDQRGKIKTGFYIDNRPVFERCPPVYLIISMGRTSQNAVVVRPNSGRTCMNIPWIMDQFVKPSSMCCDLTKVREMWDAEFALADIESEKDYQLSSCGRHRKPIYIFGGQIVPVLNKLLTATLPRQTDPNEFSNKALTLPKIVRIEICSADNESEGGQSSGAGTKLSGSLNDEGDVANVNETPAIGQKVARKIFGRTIIRGKVIECKSDGSYVAEYSDGSKVEMNGNELLEAKLLFAEELKKLTMARVANKADAATSAITKAASINPLQAVMDDIPDDFESAFEVEFKGDVPNVFVGLEFPETKKWKWGHEELELWQHVLRNLSEKNLERGIATPASRSQS